MPTKSLKNMKIAPKTTASAPKKAPVPSKKAAPKILTRIESLKLLSKLESAGVLSALEKSGVTLAFIEKNKLLSKAEDVGVISLVSDRKTPGTISTLGFALILAAAAIVFAVPDDNAGLVTLQALGVVALGGGGLAALAGSSFLTDLQK